MNVTIWDPTARGTDIRGFVVVIDVFRAFSTNCYIAEQNPERIIPVDSIERAFELRETLGERAVLVGERGGIKIDGFDYGNSPTEIVAADLRGKVIVHTTSAGTKGLLKQIESNEVVCGSFVNAAALIAYIRHRNIDTVHLYCTAPKGDAYGEEDYLFAEYFKNRLEGHPVDFEKLREEIQERSGARLIHGDFAPASDFDYCMALDRFNFVLRRVLNTPSGLVELRREDLSISIDEDDGSD